MRGMRLRKGADEMTVCRNCGHESVEHCLIRDFCDGELKNVCMAPMETCLGRRFICGCLKYEA